MAFCSHWLKSLVIPLRFVQSLLEYDADAQYESKRTALQKKMTLDRLSRSRVIRSFQALSSFLILSFLVHDHHSSSLRTGDRLDKALLDEPRTPFHTGSRIQPDVPSSILRSSHRSIGHRNSLPPTPLDFTAHWPIPPLHLYCITFLHEIQLTICKKSTTFFCAESRFSCFSTKSLYKTMKIWYYKKGCFKSCRLLKRPHDFPRKEVYNGKNVVLRGHLHPKDA